MNPFPSANELNKLTQASMSIKDTLLEQLKTAAEQGEYECTVGALLCPTDLQALLVSLGYEVHGNGRTVRISWKGK